MSLVLYGAPLSPFVRKADVVLREKGIPFELESVNIIGSVHRRRLPR